MAKKKPVDPTEKPQAAFLRESLAASGGKPVDQYGKTADQYSPVGEQKYFIPNVKEGISKAEYEAYKSSVGFQTAEGGGAQTPLVEQALAQTQGTRQQKEAQAQQQQELGAKQSQELAALGQEDFTKIGQPMPSPESIEAEGLKFNNPWSAEGKARLNEIKLAEEARLAAGGAPAPLMTGTLPIGIGAGISVAPLIAKIKTAKASLGSIKILGVAGAVYGYLTKGKVRDVEGNINDLVSLGKQLSSQVSQGANPAEVRQQLLDMENEIRDKIAELNTAKKYSIQDRLIGSDSQEYARKQVTNIVLRRQAVERYMVDGNMNAYNMQMGAYNLE
jgi:hypothetical protein